MIDAIYIISDEGEIGVRREFINISYEHEIIQLISERETKDENTNISQGEVFNLKQDAFAYVWPKAGVNFVAVASHDGYPAQIYEILQLIEHTIRLGSTDTFNFLTIQRNFSEITLIIEIFLDYGIPSIPDAHLLSTLMHSPSLVTKVKTKFFTKSEKKQEKVEYNKFFALQSFLSSVEHKDNLDPHFWSDGATTLIDQKSYFDIVENLTAIMDHNFEIVHSELSGKVMAICCINGGGEVSCQLKTASGSKIDHYYLHECALQSATSFKQNGNLTFFPTQDTFELLNYYIMHSNITMPITFLPRILLSQDELKIKFSLKSLMIKGSYLDIENVEIKICLPTSGGKGIVSNNLSASQGTFFFDDLSNIGIWTIPKLSSGKDYILEGTAKYNNPEEIKNKNSIMEMKLKLIHFAYSDAKISRAAVKSRSAIETAARINTLVNLEVRLPPIA